MIKARWSFYGTKMGEFALCKVIGGSPIQVGIVFDERHAIDIVQALNAVMVVPLVSMADLPVDDKPSPAGRHTRLEGDAP